MRNYAVLFVFGEIIIGRHHYIKLLSQCSGIGRCSGIGGVVHSAYSRTASVPKRGILFAPEVGVTAQKWPHFARVRPFEESRWSVAEWIFAGFSMLPMEALVVVFME